MKKQSDNALSHKNTLNSQFYAQTQQDRVTIDQSQIAEDAARLLMQDPSIYAYDEVYDDMKQKQKAQKIQKAVPEPTKVTQTLTQKQQSKYIKSIISTVGKRERQHEVISSKMATKKAKRQGEEGAEVFITMNYQKQLEARKQYEAQQEKAEEYNQKHSIANKNKDAFEFTAEFLKNQLQRPEKVQQKPEKQQIKQKNQKKIDTNKQYERDITKTPNKEANRIQEKAIQQQPRRDPLFNVDASSAPKPPVKFFSEKAHQQKMRLKKQQQQAARKEEQKFKAQK